MSDEMELVTCEYTDADGTGTCSQCGAQCLDPEWDGVGITVGDCPVCYPCSEQMTAQDG